MVPSVSPYLRWLRRYNCIRDRPCHRFHPVKEAFQLQLEPRSGWFPDLFYPPIPVVGSVSPYFHPLERYCQNNFRFSHNFSRSAHHRQDLFDKRLRSPITHRPIQYFAEYCKNKLKPRVD